MKKKPEFDDDLCEIKSRTQRRSTGENCFLGAVLRVNCVQRYDGSIQFYLGRVKGRIFVFVSRLQRPVGDCDLDSVRF